MYLNNKIHIKMTTENKMEMIRNMIENLQKANPHYDYDWEIQMTLDNCLGGLIKLMGSEINNPATPQPKKEIIEESDDDSEAEEREQLECNGCNEYFDKCEMEIQFGNDYCRTCINEPNEYMDEHMDCVVCERTDIPRKLLHWKTDYSYTDTCEECYILNHS